MTLSVILWGRKTCYRRALPKLRNMCDQEIFRIVGKTDWRTKPGKKLTKYPKISPADISGELCDLILIFDWKDYSKIVNFLLNQPGITRENILPGWLLADDTFDLERYRFLQKSKISILSDNCWGGFMSKTLGLEHRSPTKNCWFKDDDYLKMLSSPEHYLLESEPVFDHWEDGSGIYDEKKYPVLRLDDILVFCNHEKNAEAAIRTWIRRREKLDLENVFVEYSPYNPDFEKEFSVLNRFPRKLCLVAWETSLPYSLQYHLGPFDPWPVDAINKTALPGGVVSYYSPIELLLTGKHYMVAKRGWLYQLFCRIMNKLPRKWVEAMRKIVYR